MNIKIEIPMDQVDRFTARLFRDQIPFVTSRAINATAIEAQRAQRAHQGEAFIIRRKMFMDRAVKITPFARKESLSATIQIDPPGGRADILTKFEDGGTKKPAGTSLAIPIGARDTPQSLVRKRDRPKGLAFVRARSSVATRVSVYTGRRRTFMVRLSDGRGWIFQRTGTGRSGSLAQGTRLLYTFAPEVPIPDSLEFEETITSVVDRRFAAIFVEEFYRAALRSRL